MNTFVENGDINKNEKECGHNNDNIFRVIPKKLLNSSNIIHVKKEDKDYILVDKKNGNISKSENIEICLKKNMHITYNKEIKKNGEKKNPDKLLKFSETRKICKNFNYNKYYERVKKWKEKRCPKLKEQNNFIKIGKIKINKKNGAKIESKQNKYKKAIKQNSVIYGIIQKREKQITKLDSNNPHPNQINQEKETKANDEIKSNNINNMKLEKCINHQNNDKGNICTNTKFNGICKEINYNNLSHTYRNIEISNETNINIPYSNKTFMDSFNNLNFLNNNSNNPTIILSSNETNTVDFENNYFLNMNDENMIQIKKYINSIDQTKYTFDHLYPRKVFTEDIFDELTKKNNQNKSNTYEQPFLTIYNPYSHINITSEKVIKKETHNLINGAIKTSIYKERNEIDNKSVEYNDNNNILINNDLEHYKKFCKNNKNKFNYLKFTNKKNNNSSYLNIKNPFMYAYKRVKLLENIKNETDRKNKKMKKNCLEYDIDQKKANYNESNTIASLCEKTYQNINSDSINNSENENNKKTLKNNFEKYKYSTCENFSFNNDLIIDKTQLHNFSITFENYRKIYKNISSIKKKKIKPKKLLNSMVLNINWLSKPIKIRQSDPIQNQLNPKWEIPNTNSNILKPSLIAHKIMQVSEEIVNPNTHKKLIQITEKLIERNFDLFLCLFMKYEHQDNYLFCLIFDNELTKDSFFYQSCVKPMIDNYKKLKCEKVRNEKRWDGEHIEPQYYKSIQINKIIIEIMIPTIKKKYFSHLTKLYKEKKKCSSEVDSSDELEKEIRNINIKIKNINITKSMNAKEEKDKNISNKKNNNYEKKIKLIDKPNWSNKKNIQKLLKRQHNYNPFTIFGTSITEVNLEEIFTLDVYNNYVTNEDRFKNKILYELYITDYIQNLYEKIDSQEWTIALDTLKKHWKYFTNLECNMFLDPLLLEEILWYIDNNKMYKDKSMKIYTYEKCFCPTPDPSNEHNLNDTKYFTKSMTKKYTTEKSDKYKNLSLNECATCHYDDFVLKYDDINFDQNIYSIMYAHKKKIIKENILYNIPRPSCSFEYDSDFFHKVQKHIFRNKKLTHNNNKKSPGFFTENEPYIIKYKPKKWTSQNLFDNFFYNYYLYNFNKRSKKCNSII
ncbi:conserved Plasmodium protein, unknown function [Plasmodium berghei]|uniref:Inner centromere protein ARK-binding domain-containing protein n=2 Tax=Plasmodium berghei TaxID=5821 RepID=A0A509AQS8_PLABA|nr:conserved Plasmodium protein, unknown function [Plasmodium berghei ANKA]CXJ02615.1 conserved Plasmodium protein, unknown function [Plasmodium berghei]SCL98336.1 conserved Plasmodium protein, unknown function [Plasmodium berghei]SCM16812.1 conserved Plasmodium protein, unknown function [Plasmodium berghei]SCM18610.1 conserved Plasmodium protein, unknown function [Plasmodium berghei]SCN28045.1 conserved Plasmodium protein, unknown function [Plasmodium berghei]|eukprot:XP_034423696.1 conserved Plasmodium protein, unknown function [Plasmodium berghei ANKA]